MLDIATTRSNQGLISAFEHWSLVHNTCHVPFFVDKITHFLYASEAVNKFQSVDGCNRPIKNFQKGLSLNLLSADEEYNSTWSFENWVA